jgi:hypothetical protein
LNFPLPGFQCLNEGFDHSHGLGGITGVADADSVIAMCLVFRRSLAKGLANGVAELQLGFGARGFAIGEALAAEVFDGRQDVVKLLDAAPELFDQGGFGSRA